MKKLFCIIMTVLMLVTVMAPCVLAADDGASDVQEVEVVAEAPTDEATGEADAVPPAVDDAGAENEADAAANEAEETPAESASTSFYSPKNLIIGGVSIGLMVIAFVILKIKSNRG